MTSVLRNFSKNGQADENINPDENDPNGHIRIESYKDESQIDVIMDLIGKELSEPYSIYTYRYFLNTWPELTLLVSFLDIVVTFICFRPMTLK
jgi:hypothetical protein